MTAPTEYGAPDPGDGAGWARTLDPIADAYAAAIASPPDADADIRECWRTLASVCRADADAIRSGAPVRVVGPDGTVRFRSLTVAVSDDPEPYVGPAEMAADAARGRFIVSRANSDHPLWTRADNVAFRIAHDVRGHLSTGGDFGWIGENRACDGHRRAIRNFSGGIWSTRTRTAAARAMFTECIAQTGYAIARGGFGEQVCAILPRPDAAPLPETGGRYAVARLDAV